MANKNKVLSPYSITKAFNKYLKGIKNRGVLYDFGEHNDEKSFKDFLAEVKENGERLGLFAYIPSLEELANRPDAYHDYIVAMVESLKQYAKSSKGAQLSQRRFVANAIYPIITDAVSKNVGLGFSESNADKILKIVFPEDKNAKRKDKKQNIKIKKTHPKLTRFMKKFVAPTLVTAGVIAAALGVFAALPITSAIIPQLITDSLLVNVATFATIGAVGGLVLTPAIILIKNAATKHYYNKHYGAKSSNLSTIYSQEESLSKIKNAEKLEEKINGMNLPIMNLWNKIRQTEDKIRETEKKHPHAHKLLNYFRLKTNRNRIHTLGQTINFFNDQQSAQPNENLQVISNLLKKNLNSLIASPTRYGDLVARYNLPRYTEGKHIGKHIGFNDPKVFVPKFRELMRDSYKNALTGGKVVADEKPEKIVDKKETNKEKSSKKPALALPLSPEGERKIKLIKEAQERQNQEVKRIAERQAENTQEKSNTPKAVITPPPVNNSKQEKEDKSAEDNKIKIEENNKFNAITSDIRTIIKNIDNSIITLNSKNNIATSERVKEIISINSQLTVLKDKLTDIDERIDYVKSNSLFADIVDNYKAYRKTITSKYEEYDKYLEGQRAIVINQEAKAKQKAEEERKAKEKAEAERIAKEKAEAEKKAEAERKAKEAEEAKKQAEKERKVKEQAEAERIAKEKAEAEKKAEAERKAKEAEEAKKQAEKERKAKEKAEAERIAKEKAEAEKKAEAERKAKEAEEAKKQAEKERKARKNAEAREKFRASLDVSIQRSSKIEISISSKIDSLNNEQLSTEERQTILNEIDQLMSELSNIIESLDPERATKNKMIIKEFSNDFESIKKSYNDLRKRLYDSYVKNRHNSRSSGTVINKTYGYDEYNFLDTETTEESHTTININDK